MTSILLLASSMKSLKSFRAIKTAGVGLSLVIYWGIFTDVAIVEEAALVVDLVIMSLVFLVVVCVVVVVKVGKDVVTVVVVIDEASQTLLVVFCRFSNLLNLSNLSESISHPK